MIPPLGGITAAPPGPSTTVVTTSSPFPSSVPVTTSTTAQPATPTSTDMQVETASTKRKAEDEGDESRLRNMSEDVDINYVMVNACVVEEDLPHECVKPQAAEHLEISSVWIQDERKVYSNILLNEVYPEDYRRNCLRGLRRRENLCGSGERCYRARTRR